MWGQLFGGASSWWLRGPLLRRDSSSLYRGSQSLVVAVAHAVVLRLWTAAFGAVPLWLWWSLKVAAVGLAVMVLGGFQCLRESCSNIASCGWCRKKKTGLMLIDWLMNCH